ncbi:MAG TPA: glycosyltransferase family 39 protein, partial [Streptosporangiaceae bacterium]|nr:glycosyltransferase family 39 protein [Streptosporangiaceae bacterium]
SLRLIKADTAFQDEALYLWAGHREIDHLLHGVPVPPFPTYFSGAPVIYPLFGALGDSIGGLSAARILSLVFMLGATGLLWSTTRLLYGEIAAFFAAALFAIGGPTLHLGSFATYDAMSVFLVALSAWCVVKASQRPGDEPSNATGWMITAGLALAAANATAYSIALFDPVVIGLAFIANAGRTTARLALRRCLTMFIVLIAGVGLGVLIGGGYYRTGINNTTIQRAPGPDSALTIFTDSWFWTGSVAVIALIAVIISLSRRPWTPMNWLPLLATAALLLVPTEQASLHTTASLSKHGTMGAWFASIAAGVAVDAFVAWSGAGRTRMITLGACVVALVLPAKIGISQAQTFATQWSNSTSFTAILGPLVNNSPGRVLVEDPSIAEYYLKAGSDWRRWSGTRNIVLPSGKSTGGPNQNAGVVGPGNAGVYAVFIQEGYFSLVALNFADTTALDKAIRADLKHNHRYHIIDVIPYGPEHGTYVIWRYEPRR